MEGVWSSSRASPDDTFLSGCEDPDITPLNGAGLVGQAHSLLDAEINQNGEGNEREEIWQQGKRAHLKPPHDLNFMSCELKQSLFSTSSSLFSMPITRSDLKAICEGMIKDLQIAKDPLKTLGTARADVRLIGSQSSEARVRGFNIISDETKTGGGEDKAPNPLDYFMSSIGFCENVIVARHAALYGLSLDSLETSVNGHWDRKGQFEIDETDPSFKDISIETKITTNDPIDAVAKVIRIAHRRCPMYATVTKAAKVTTRLVVNGKDVAL